MKNGGSKLKKHNFAGKPMKIALLVLPAVLFFSCATVPKIPVSSYDGGAELSFLPAGGKAYLWVDMEKGRSLVDVFSFDGKSSKDAGKILDSTTTVAATVFPEDQSRKFYLAALGDFPRAKANFSMVFSSAWKKQKSVTGNRYWYSKKDGLALALGSNVALVSNIDPFEAFSKEIPPQGFTEFRRGLSMAGWMPDPSVSINTFLDTLGLPIQIPAEEFCFGIARAPANLLSGDSHPADKAQWELVFRIKTPSAIHARSLVSLIQVARFFLSRSGTAAQGEGFGGPQDMAALLFARSPEQNEDILVLRTDPIDENSIALLFNMFSVNSKNPW